MSNLLRANDADRDAIALSRALLQSMVDDGNLPAREFHGRLAALQRDVDALLAAAGDVSSPGSGKGGGGGGGGGGVLSVAQPPPLRGYVTSTGTFAANVPRDFPHHQHIKSLSSAYRIPGSGGALGSGVSASNSEALSTAPLDAPFIQDFLGNFDSSWSPGNLDLSNDEEVPWSLSWEATDPV